MTFFYSFALKFVFIMSRYSKRAKQVIEIRKEMINIVSVRVGQTSNAGDACGCLQSINNLIIQLHKVYSRCVFDICRDH